MNILVLAPHPDDETIGCGGSIRGHSRQGHRVSVVFFTSGELGLKRLPKEEAWRVREEEARRAARILGVSELHFFHGADWGLADATVSKQMISRLRPVLEQETPELVYVPHPNEGHPDHQAVWPIFRRALKRSGIERPEIRAYEVWTPLSRVDYVTDISKLLSTKLRALRAHRSQLGEFDYIRALRGLNQYRGALFGKCSFAEVFQDLSDQA